MTFGYVREREGGRSGDRENREKQDRKKQKKKNAEGEK